MKSLKRNGPDIGKLVLVMCPNRYGFHGKGVYTRIAFWGFGYWMDNPTYSWCTELVKEMEYHDIEGITAECSCCAKRTAKLS